MDLNIFFSLNSDENLHGKRHFVHEAKNERAQDKLDTSNKSEKSYEK